ncbi:DUF3307 domain-containing protein [Actinomadura hibisca]|uniref:DUF3307 domain-containing protein n=1 Tax=Actinomadura hibisca TaxID=68565 RepID=UPI0008366431|nr:DUF3307 domain-containing protein [Actinomadura hibisca]
MAAITFAVTLSVLWIAHHVADHWIQTDCQAITKGRPARDEAGTRDRSGQLADLRHVLSLTAVLAAALLAVAWRVDIAYDPARFVVALLVNGASHYWADRRVYLLRLARAIGKGGWLDNDPTAAYTLDQSWHLLWLLITALIIV